MNTQPDKATLRRNILKHYGQGLSVGLVMGLSFGIALQNAIAGILTGIGFGLAVGLALDQREQEKVALTKIASAKPVVRKTDSGLVTVSYFVGSLIGMVVGGLLTGEVSRGALCGMMLGRLAGLTLEWRRGEKGYARSITMMTVGLLLGSVAGVLLDEMLLGIAGGVMLGELASDLIGWLRRKRDGK